MPVPVNQYDLLIVGGGPAGMAGAVAAAEQGLTVLLVDERPTLGGQVYKQPGPGMRVVDPRAMGAAYQAGRELIDRVEGASVPTLLSTTVVDLARDENGWVAHAQTEGRRAEQLCARRVLVAAGAHDRPVVFPGWTLPGVVTAGGLQTLVKTQAYVPPGRTVFAGSGPVALAFPAQLAKAGVDVVAVLEAGPAPAPRDLARVAGATAGNTGLLLDAARYRAGLATRGIAVRHRRIVVRAEGEGRVERVVHAAVDQDWQVVPGTEESTAAEVLCLGYGFTPSVELLRLLGCTFETREDLGGPVVRRDEWLRTDVPGLYAAGDGAGVEGSAVAVDEGRVAALAAALDAGRIGREEALQAARPAQRRIGRRRALAGATSRMYRVGQGVFGLGDQGTVVCRCEEVTQGQVDRALDEAPDVNSVKGLTRAGMGPCQGRMCGRHIAALAAARRGCEIGEVEPATTRMPIRPISIAAVADPQVDDPGLFVVEADHAQTPAASVPDLSQWSGASVRETDVLVIGGGIAGAALTYYLAREGAEVELLERGELNREASGTNAGSFHFQLAIHQLSGHGTDADRTRLLSDARASVVAYELWKNLDAELGADLGLHQTGGWMVAETPDQLDLLHQKRVLEAEAGIDTEVVTGAELRNRAPFFSDRVLGATYCGLEGHANPLVVAPLYVRRAVELGARVRTQVEVQAVKVHHDRDAPARFSVYTSDGVIRARHLVNCAGGWAAELAAMVGLHFPIRREGLHVNVTEARPLLLPAMVQHIGRRLTLKQSSHGSFIIGGGWPTPSATATRRAPTAWRSAAGNLGVALDIVPDLADVRVLRTWSGAIAFTDDMSPVVGQSHAVPGYHACVATTGFTFSPLYARQLAEQILAGGPSPFPERFSLDRGGRTVPDITPPPHEKDTHR